VDATTDGGALEHPACAQAHLPFAALAVHGLAWQLLPSSCSSALQPLPSSCSSRTCLHVSRAAVCRTVLHPTFV
jgi:hypothetical protein